MIKPFTQDSSFYDFTRRVWNTPDQQRELLAAVDNVPEPLCDELAVGLNQEEWNETTLKTATLFTALKALIQKKLNPSQIFTLYQFKNGVEISEGEIKIVNLFFKKIASQFAENCLIDTLPEGFDIQAFFNEMKFKPLSEQRFFLIPEFAPPDEKPRTISQFLFVQADFNIFGRLTFNKVAYQMIPSFGMIEAYAKIRGSVIPIPTLGLSSREDIRSNFEKGMQDIAIATEMSPLPPLADEKPANKIEFPKHDIYHLENHLAMPVNHGKAFVIVLHILPTLKNVIHPDIIEAIMDRITDCEYYRPNAIPNMHPSTYFWLVLGSVVNEQPLTQAEKNHIIDTLLVNMDHMWRSDLRISFKRIFGKVSLPYPGLLLLRNRVRALN